VLYRIDADFGVVIDCCRRSLLGKVISKPSAFAALILVCLPFSFVGVPGDAEDLRCASVVRLPAGCAPADVAIVLDLCLLLFLLLLLLLLLLLVVVISIALDNVNRVAPRASGKREGGANDLRGTLVVRLLAGCAPTDDATVPDLLLLLVSGDHLPSGDGAAPTRR